MKEALCMLILLTIVLLFIIEYVQKFIIPNADMKHFVILGL